MAGDRDAGRNHICEETYFEMFRRILARFATEVSKPLKFQFRIPHIEQIVLLNLITYFWAQDYFEVSVMIFQMYYFEAGFFSFSHSSDYIWGLKSIKGGKTTRT